MIGDSVGILLVHLTERIHPSYAFHLSTCTAVLSFRY